MSYFDYKIKRQQLDAKLKPLKEFDSIFKNQRRSWIKLIRKVFGMSTYQLASILNNNQSRVVRMEKDEVDQKITLETLNRVAEAMDMKFVYGFVPKTGTLEDIVERRARKLAIDRLKRIGHSMALEDQSLDKEENKKALENMVQKILVNEYKQIWNP
jgi:predicted DNA-binding mobile mystery protein A